MIKRACVTCGKPGPKSYCDEHQPEPWASSTRRNKVKLSGSAEQARAKRILEQHLYCCHVCGKVGADQVDHVTPLSEGGADDESNLAPIHAKPCHVEKTAAESARAKARNAAMVRRRYQR